MGPEVAALPQVLGEMTLLIRLHQTCGQDSVGWAGKAAYGAHGLVSKGVALIGAVWDVLWLRPLTRWLQQSAEHMLSFGRVFSLQQICAGARQGWGGENQASVHFSLLTHWQPLNE